MFYTQSTSTVISGQTMFLKSGFPHAFHSLVVCPISQFLAQWSKMFNKTAVKDCLCVSTLVEYVLACVHFHFSQNFFFFLLYFQLETTISVHFQRCVFLLRDMCNYLFTVIPTKCPPLHTRALWWYRYHKGKFTVCLSVCMNGWMDGK